MNLKNERPIIVLSKQETAININKNLLTFMSAGNKRLITDLLWVQTLIESDVEHYKKDDLNNWLFLRFNTIASLDPRFYENYLFGGQFLAIIKDDLEGAEVLYSKGLEQFPEDYHLNYAAGFLNYYEMGNFKKGLTYLEKVKNHPRAPHYIGSIINKLKAATGIDLNTIFELVLHDYELAKEPRLKEKLRKELYALKSQIDLRCLNNGKTSCDTKDLNGDAYILKKGKYFSPEAFVPYMINRREANPLPSSEKQTHFYE